MDTKELTIKAVEEIKNIADELYANYEQMSDLDRKCDICEIMRKSNKIVMLLKVAESASK